MAKWSLPMEGGCRCGDVRFRMETPPMLTMICHCTGCQRMTGGAYSTTVMVPSDGFSVTAGEPVIGGLHDEKLPHYHCPRCKSWLFTRLPREYGTYVNVRATMLDDTTWFVPFVENYTSEAMPWATVRDAAHTYQGFPPPAEYPALLAEFAARHSDTPVKPD